MASISHQDELAHYKEEVSRLTKLVDTLKADSVAKSVEINRLRTELASALQRNVDSTDSTANMRLIADKRQMALDKVRSDFERQHPGAICDGIANLSVEAGYDEIDSLPDGATRDPAIDFHVQMTS